MADLWPLDYVFPLQSYTAEQHITGYANIKSWLTEADKVNKDEVFYPNGKQDDPAQPMKLYILTYGATRVLTPGTKFDVLAIPYHAKTTLRKGVKKEGAYQCAHIALEDDSEWYIWPVYNDNPKKILPGGFTTLIADGETLTCKISLVAKPGGGYELSNVDCGKPTPGGEVGSATVYAHAINSAGKKVPLEDVAILLEDEDGKQWQAVTQDDGRVDFHGLPPGTYAVKTAYDGWKDF